MNFRKSCGYVALGVGIFVASLSLIVLVSWPWIFAYVQKENVKLSPNSETYKLWKKTPLPMYLEIYLFNWTNAVQFMENKRLKPKFEEVGPFVFQEVHEKVNVFWSNNGSVTYNQTRRWTFLPEKSVSLSVPIVNLNVVASTVTKMASNYKSLLKMLVDFLTFVYKEKLLINRPAAEWLFEGMDDKLLDFIKRFFNLPYDKFGWFYGRNMSSSFDGIFNVYTGEENIYDLGKLNTWNNMHNTKYFQDECGEVLGKSSELFSPLVKLQSNISIFITDFCSFITLRYAGITNVKEVEGYHYVGDESVFDNGTQYPRSRCFCNGDCSPRGIRNVTSCRQAPLFISFPHFYLADSSYVEAVDGMRPNKKDHEFYLDIDPLTGIPLHLRAQLQLNVLLEPSKQFSMFSGVPKVYVPMMWFKQTARITPDLLSKSEKFRMVVNQVLWSFRGLLALGFAVILIVVLRKKNVFGKCDFRHTKSETLLSETTNSEVAPEEEIERKR